MERVMNGLFRPIQYPRRCLAYRFFQAINQGEHVKNPVILTTTQGVIILGVIALLFAGTMEARGHSAPGWLTTIVISSLTYLAGVATPNHSSEPKNREKSEL